MDPLVVPARLDSLRPIRDYIRKASAAVGLGEDATYRLLLGADEIATNAIEYGYIDCPGKSGEPKLTVSVENTPCELVVVMEDRARPFDPRDHAMPTTQELMKGPEERSIGGLGIYLALTGVDRFGYEPLPDGNRNILAMKRPCGG